MVAETVKGRKLILYENNSENYKMCETWTSPFFLFFFYTTDLSISPKSIIGYKKSKKKYNGVGKLVIPISSKVN